MQMSELMNSSFLGTKYMENCEAMTSSTHSFAYSYRLFKKCFDENLPYFLSDLRKIVTVLFEMFYSFYWFNLKTLFNIVEAPLKKKLNFDVCVVWWCSDGPINSQEYSFEIYAVSIKVSMTEYHHWINGLADHLF